MEPAVWEHCLEHAMLNLCLGDVTDSEIFFNTCIERKACKK